LGPSGRFSEGLGSASTYWNSTSTDGERAAETEPSRDPGPGERRRTVRDRTPFYSLVLKVMRRLTVIVAVLALIGGAGPPVGAQPHDAERSRIQPSADHPRYWQYEGEPVLLIGGSKEDNLFQVDSLEAHLDQLAAVGGNYVRNTMSARDEGNVWSFHRRSDGRYNLRRGHGAYYHRLERLLRRADDRDIIVQIELWDRFDFAREPWQRNPFRPANNVNYTASESGLENAYSEHPNANENPFFRSVPAQNDNRLVLQFQKARVERLLDVTLSFPNVLYVIDNETSAPPEWGAYWARFLKQKADSAGTTVQVTEMWDDWNLRGEQHRHTLDHPSRYDYAEVSQNNHNDGQKHWNNLMWVRRYTADRPWILNSVKVYGADGDRYGSARDGVERFWRHVIGGTAAVRFHRPSAGLGLGPTARRHLRSARRLLDRYDLLAAEPGATNRLAERAPNEAYVSVGPDATYAVYFPDGGAVQFPLGEGARKTSYRVSWLDPAASAWTEERRVTVTDHLDLSAPGAGHWIAVIEKTSSP